MGDWISRVAAKWRGRASAGQKLCAAHNGVAPSRHRAKWRRTSGRRVVATAACPMSTGPGSDGHQRCHHAVVIPVRSLFAHRTPGVRMPHSQGRIRHV